MLEMVPRTKPTTYGGLLRFLRQERGVTLGDMARHLGVDVVRLSEVERDMRAPFTEAQTDAAAKVLGIDAAELHEARRRHRASDGNARHVVFAPVGGCLGRLFTKCACGGFYSDLRGQYVKDPER